MVLLLPLSHSTCPPSCWASLRPTSRRPRNPCVEDRSRGSTARTATAHAHLLMTAARIRSCPRTSPSALLVRQMYLSWDVLSVMYITDSMGESPLFIMCMFWEGEKRGAFLTSRVMASARSPRSRMACAAASISAVVRAASVTCAPACASAEAAASPMPRPPPVTSARLPSSRNDGVFVSSIFTRPPGHRRRCGRHSGARAHWPARRGRGILRERTAASNIRRSTPKPRR